MNQADLHESVEALIARMDIAQELGQMTQPERLHINPDEVRLFHIGSVLSGGGSFPGANLPADWVVMNDAYWQASAEEGEGHVGTPLIYVVDATRPGYPPLIRGEKVK